MRATSVFTAALTLSLVSGIASAQDKTPKAKPSDNSDRAAVERDITRIRSSDGRVRVYAGGSGNNHFELDIAPRAMIGINTSSSGARDTLGLLVTSVMAGGPAEKAGIIEGNRIAAVNGVNLRLAAADAGQDDMEGITARRLTRELGKLQPGAEVDLRVYADGQWKNVKVKTVSSDSLRGERATVQWSSRDERPVLGFSLNSSGNKRDTLGVLIGNVEENGPADKAGLIEGDRVVSVNGTDLRVKREDVGDDYVSNAMVSRFQRVMRGVKPGDKVELRVYSGGQTKTVSVPAARSADVYKEGDHRFRMFMPGNSFRMTPMPPMPAMPAMPAVPPMPADVGVWFEGSTPMLAPMPMRIRRPQIHSMNLNDDDIAPFVSGDLDGDAELDDDADYDSDVAPEIDFDAIPDVDIAPPSEWGAAAKRALNRARSAVEAAKTPEPDAKSEAEAALRAREEARALNEQTRRMVESMINQQRSLDRATAKSASFTPKALLSGKLADLKVATPPRETGSSTIHIAGLTLAPVTTDLAEYLGEGSRDGFLVLESEGEWSAVHPGDVLLSVNGQCVKASGSVATLDSEDAHDIVVLRKGQRTTVHLVGG